MNKLQIIIGAIGLGVILLLSSALYTVKQDSKHLETALQISKDSTKHYRLKNGELIATTKVMQLTTDQLKKDGENLEINNKKLKQQVGDLTKLNFAYQAEVKVLKSFKTSTHDSIVYLGGDTTKKVVYKDFNYRTKYIDFKGYFKPLDNTLFAQYTYTPFLSIALYRQSDGFLKGHHTQAVASFDDPDARLDNQHVVVVDNTKKKWWERDWIKIVGGAALGYKLAH